MIKFLYSIKSSIKSRWYIHVFLQYLRKQFAKCGDNVVISDGVRIAGEENISFGDDVYIGPGALLYTTRAKLIFGSHITVGPKLTIITGDHRTDVVGEYMKKWSKIQLTYEKLHP